MTITNEKVMKKTGTLFLKAVLVALGVAVLALCIFAFPGMGKGMAREFPSIPYLEYSIAIGYATAISFFIALFQAWKLLTYIDKNTGFSELSVKALKNIKYCAISISVFYLSGMPFVVQMAHIDDAPGAVLFGLIISGAPIVIAVFATLLQKLIQSAIDKKAENDLTV